MEKVSEMSAKEVRAAIIEATKELQALLAPTPALKLTGKLPELKEKAKEACALLNPELADDLKLSDASFTLLNELEFLSDKYVAAYTGANEDEDESKKNKKDKKGKKDKKVKEEPAIEETPVKEKKLSKKEKKAAKKAAAEKKEKPAPKKKGPGIIATIVACVEGASTKKGVSKAEILKVLTKAFPEKEPSSMKSTINVQVPNRITKEKFEVGKTKDGGYFKVVVEEKKDKKKKKNKK